MPPAVDTDLPQPYRQPKGRDIWAPENEWEWEGFPEFLPFLDAPSRLGYAWYAPFLKHLATHGEKMAAAMYARVGRSTMYRAIDADPVFAAELEAAQAYFKARCEAGLMHNTRVTGNPAGVIVRNKGEQPMKYIEKSAVVSVNLTGELGPVDAQAVLCGMLRDLSPATRQLLTRETPPALPETTP